MSTPSTTTDPKRPAPASPRGASREELLAAVLELHVPIDWCWHHDVAVDERHEKGPYCDITRICRECCTEPEPDGDERWIGDSCAGKRGNHSRHSDDACYPCPTAEAAGVQS
jgi:hypothetical protein